MACHEWAERISAYIDEELTAAERGAVVAHLAACAGCAKAAEELRRVSGLVRALPRVAAPAGLVESVRAAVAPPAQGRLIRFIGRNRSWVSSAAAVVATMLIVYGFYSPSRNRFKEASPDARPVAATNQGQSPDDRRPSIERDSSAAGRARPDFEVAEKRATAAGPMGGGIEPPAPPRESAKSRELARKEAKEEDPAAGQSARAAEGLAAVPRADKAAPAAPGAPDQADELRKTVEKASDDGGLAQDFLRGGREVTMLCGDPDDAEHKVTRLLRDLRVVYRVVPNDNTHVVAQIPAGRAEEVLEALDMLEPGRFGWRVPVNAGDDPARKDFATGARASSKGVDRAAGRRGRLAMDLLANTLGAHEEDLKEKSLAESEQRRQAAAELTLIISLEAEPAAEPATEGGR